MNETLERYREVYYELEEGGECLGCYGCRYDDECMRYVYDTPHCYKWLADEFGISVNELEKAFFKLEMEELTFVIHNAAYRLIGFAIAEMVMSHDD